MLICDDSETDIFFLLRAITASKVSNPIFAVRGGRELLNYLEGKTPFTDRNLHPIPNVVFLDLRMTSPDGFEILRWKQTRPELARTLFVAMSNFDGVTAINQAYANGAATFLAKPLNAADVKNIVLGFEDRWELAPDGRCKGSAAPAGS